jgi:TIR domain
MKVFLSYASEDKAVAESIAFSLRGRGHKVFLDRDNLPPGGSYDQQIESAVNESDVFVFLVSPDSVAHGRYSLTELTFARRKWPDPNNRVLPVMVRNTPFEDVPPYLRAVSLLEPIGNITAETSSAVHNMRFLKERSDEVSPQYLNAIGLGIVALVTFVFIAVAVEHPIVNGWDILGLAVPFYIAIITYAVFSWLDRHASDEAIEVISSWMHGRSYNKPDLGNLIIKAFDRIYTSPLLSFRGFRRSAAVSSTIWLLIFAIPWLYEATKYWSYLWNRDVMTDQIDVSVERFHILIGICLAIGLTLIIVILVDYVSLLFVRKFLLMAQTRPIIFSLSSSFLGFVVVLLGFIAVSTGERGITYWLGIIDHIPKLTDLLDPSMFVLVMKPAFVIHLWLPLFALSLVVVKLLYLIFRAVEWAQWFLKQGDAHPLKAIGIVATIIVFGSAMLVKEGWALLSVLERS